ncbi:MAG: nucleotidyl transferase AbiEii/AbiGii toxin family protein [Candidatus Saliniplasma sp.]
MISRDKLRDISKKTSLHLYQQEKDYLIKLFLFNYFRKYDNAIFKGGTCLRYLYGTERFSEDIDFNLMIAPQQFKKEVDKILEEFKSIGIENGFVKEEIFDEAYTCEVWFYGPLYEGSNQTQNKFRLDAGERGGTLLEPKWRLIDSEYPETKKKFLVQTMDEDELLVEKIITLFTRSKGRDLYDVWYLLMNDGAISTELFERKLRKLLDEYGIRDDFSWDSYPSKEEYTEDMKRLVPNVIPYSQVKTEVEDRLEELKEKVSLDI